MTDDVRRVSEYRPCTDRIGWDDDPNGDHVILSVKEYDRLRAELAEAKEQLHLANIDAFNLQAELAEAMEER